jgi:hypothetical protein
MIQIKAVNGNHTNVGMVVELYSCSIQVWVLLLSASRELNSKCRTKNLSRDPLKNVLFCLWPHRHGSGHGTSEYLNARRLVRSLLRCSWNHFKIQPFRLTAFEQSHSKGLNHVFGIVTIEKLAVGYDTGSVVYKGNQKGFTPCAIGLFDGRAVHRIGLLRLIGVLHRKGMPEFFGLFNIEQIILPNHAIKRGW